MDFTPSSEPVLRCAYPAISLSLKRFFTVPSMPNIGNEASISAENGLCVARCKISARCRALMAPCVTSPRRFPAPVPEIAVVVSLTIFASPQYCARCLLREGRCDAAGHPPAYSLRVLAAGHPQGPAMGLIIPHPRYPRLPAQHEVMFH